MTFSNICLNLIELMNVTRWMKSVVRLYTGHLARGFPLGGLENAFPRLELPCRVHEPQPGGVGGESKRGQVPLVAKRLLFHFERGLY